MPEVKIQTATTPDRIEFMFKTAQQEIANKIGIRNAGKLAEKDFKKLEELMAKNKKPVEYFISFDGEWFGFFAKVGTVKIEITSISVTNDPSITDKEKVLNNLLAYGAASKAQVEAQKNASDPSITDKEKVLNNLLAYGAASKA